MAKLLFDRFSKKEQYFLSISLILFVSCICYFLSCYIGYRVVALLLPVTVSFITMFFQTAPVLIATLFSALVWNFCYLLNEVWNPGYINGSQCLRVFIGQLREKIETEPNHPEYILTEPEVGYRFVGKENK